MFLELKQVDISGTFELKEEEGTDVVFTCSYNTVIPNVNRVEFYIDGVKIHNSKVRNTQKLKKKQFLFVNKITHLHFWFFKAKFFLC